MPGLKGKNLLVTGGSSGIGQAIAVRFAARGANVAINYLTTPDEAAGTEEQVRACLHKVHQHDVRDLLVQGDVSREDDVVHMVGEARERLGGLDILVNNAGIQISQPSEARCASRRRGRRAAGGNPRRRPLDQSEHKELRCGVLQP
jgi:glucose 1-dehydrogenase